MTSVATAPGRPFVRNVALLGALVVVAAVVVFLVATFVFSLWGHRNDVAVDFDPEQEAGRPFGEVRGESPSSNRLAVVSTEGLLIVEGDDQVVLADLGDVDEVTFVSEDRFIAFGQDQSMVGFEGLAVVDLAEQSVEQVDLNDHTIGGLAPVSVDEDGVVACELGPDSHGDGPPRCTEVHFLIDPTAAELLPT